MAPHSTMVQSYNVANDTELVADILEQRPHELLQPSQQVHSSILALSKLYLDPVALNVSLVQTQRLQEERKSKKRKRSERAGNDVLRLKSVTVDGFDAEQVWAQARRITQAVQSEVQRIVEEQRNLQDAAQSSSEDEQDDTLDVAMSDVQDSEGEVASQHLSEDEEDEEDDIDLNAAIEEYESEGSEDSENSSAEPEFVQDKFGLNDEFFSIDEFNRRTEMLEQQDFNGEPDLEAASDEEDLDYEVDPMSIAAPKTSKSHTRKSKAKDIESRHAYEDEELDSQEDEDEEQGPVFGDMDLNAPEGASDEDNEEGDEDDADSKAFMYNDFFEAPARKSRNSRVTSRPKAGGFDADSRHAPVDFEADMQRAMSAVHKDIFSDEEEEDEAPPPKSRAAKQADKDLSSHEKRQAEILAQIRQLEGKLVAKRPWVLAGEAKASDRPQNALLEEDLDFERTGKPLPVVTKETSEEIEELIKRRILAGEFDEVRKRRPGEELNSGSAARRGRLLDQDLEAPRQKGLAEVYEEEHLAKNDPAYVDKRTEKLTKEHAEIGAMWKDISHKLDSLASFRYRPKPSDVTISVRSDAPALSLEDARPSGVGGDVGSMDQLAPQEIYTPGEVKEKGKVVTKGGTVIDKAELTREERKRRRRREKERAKKAGAQKEEARTALTGKSRADDRNQLAGDLKKGGVKVITRKGEVQDVEGKDVQQAAQRSAGAFKL